MAQTTLLLLLLREPLFWGTSTFWHDNLYWNYPAFQFFAESWLQGTIPFWNPYSHGGEPFYPLLLQMRFLEPITLLTLSLAGMFTRNLPILFHWNRIALSLFFVIGTYLWLRPHAKSFLAKAGLQSLLLFSSVMLNSFRADAALNHVLWIPYLAIALDRLFLQGKSTWQNWAFLTLCLGINFQSYFFALPFTFALLYGIAVALFYRLEFRRFFSQEKLVRKGLFVVSALALFCAPNFSLLINRGELLYTARLLPKQFATAPERDWAAPYRGGEFDESNAVGFSVDAISYGGSPASLWNYAQLLLPEGNPWIFGKLSDIPMHFGTPSEVFIYLGFLPLFLALYGIFCGRSRRKRLFLFLTAAFFLLSFGPSGGLHRLLFLFPPLWFLRHLQFATLFVALGLLYFFVLGVDALYERHRSRTALSFFALSICSLLAISYRFTTDPKFFTAELFWFLAVPSAFLIWRRSSRVTTSVLFCLILWDLTLHFRRMDTLYGVVTPPPLITQSSVTAQPLPFPETRYEAPDYPPIRIWGSQRPRYLSNVDRKAYAFSKVIRPEEAAGDVMRHGLNNVWWDGLYVPRDYFTWIQDQTDPSVVRKILGIGLSTIEFEGSWKTLSFGANHLEVRTNSKTDGHFLWKNRFDRDWRVSIDEKPVDTLRTSPFFLTASVPSGTHRLQFHYFPRNFMWALGAFYFVLFLMLTMSSVESASTACDDSRMKSLREYEGIA